MVERAGGLNMEQERSSEAVPMVMRTVRVPRALWDEARAVAEASEDSISNVVRTSLSRYVKQDERKRKGRS
jgi:hypothetical protein